ncbi:MAG: serine hydrolase domain-containing protein [Bacteroidota bacterium]
MKRKSSIVCFFIVLMAFAQNDSDDKIEMAKAILDSIVHRNNHVGLSAAIMVKGKTLLAQGFGYKNMETNEVPDANTLFRIYSISKPLAGLLAMKMVEEQKLNIDKEIGSILPGLPKHLHQITSKHLLAHISGIRHYKNGWKEWDSISQFRCKTPLEALDVFVKDSLLFNPGEQVSYTSFGYVLLSAILEKVGKKPFTELMEEKIFVPSEAKRIQLDGPIETYPENITSFYDIENGKIVKTRPVNNSCKFGGGGFNASAHAVAKVWRPICRRELLMKKLTNIQNGK